MGRRKVKVTRLPVTLDPAERATLRERARLHGTTMAGFLRTAALGPSPARRGVAADADTWWDSLPASRRAQVHGWLTKPTPGDAMPGQLAMLEASCE